MVSRSSFLQSLRHGGDRGDVEPGEKPASQQLSDDRRRFSNVRTQFWQETNQRKRFWQGVLADYETTCQLAGPTCEA